MSWDWNVCLDFLFITDCIPSIICTQSQYPRDTSCHWSGGSAEQKGWKAVVVGSLFSFRNSRCDLLMFSAFMILACECLTSEHSVWGTQALASAAFISLPDDILPLDLALGQSLWANPTSRCDMFHKAHPHAPINCRQPTGFLNKWY